MNVTLDDRSVELTDEQLSMFQGLTKLKRGVALNTLAGMSPSDAHRDAGGTCKDESRRTSLASEILLNPVVSRFIASFNVQRIAPAVMSRAEMLERLSIMARTNINDIVDIRHTGDELMNLETGEMVKGQTSWSLKDCNDMTNGGIAAISELTAGKEGYKFKLHDQRAAMKQLAELMGYDAPVKAEVKMVKELDDFYDE